MSNTNSASFDVNQQEEIKVVNGEPCIDETTEDTDHQTVVYFHSKGEASKVWFSGHSKKDDNIPIQVV